MAEIKGTIRNTTQKLTGSIKSMGAKGDKGDKGDPGVGVVSAVLNADYTLTLTLSDGTAYTTPSIRGEKGDKGDKGPAGYRFTNNNGNIVITEVD